MGKNDWDWADNITVAANREKTNNTPESALLTGDMFSAAMLCHW
jgi:hypothetical protein